jgi:hypothetical protein
VDNEEIARFVPWFLEGRYPGCWRPVIEGTPDLGYALEVDGACVLVRAGKAQTPFIWLRGGIAHAIPKTDQLAFHVASQNKDLMVGRVYLAYGDDVAMVAFDEAIVTGDLDVERPSSAQDFINRFEMSLDYTRKWADTILQRFGGRRFTAADLMLMSF